MERDELCALVGLLSQYTTGTLSLREKRSGHVRRYWKRMLPYRLSANVFQVPVYVFVKATQTRAHNSVTLQVGFVKSVFVMRKCIYLCVLQNQYVQHKRLYNQHL